MAEIFSREKEGLVDNSSTRLHDITGESPYPVHPSADAAANTEQRAKITLATYILVTFRHLGDQHGQRWAQSTASVGTTFYLQPRISVRAEDWKKLLQIQPQPYFNG